MKFYLGTHLPRWLGRTEFADVPLFVSAIRLRKLGKPVRAVGQWALDSGGFSELTMNGTWTVPAKQYAKEVRAWQDEIGNLDWAAIQDWMCEPIIREGGWVGKGKSRRRVPGTRLSVGQHQTLTTNSYLELMSLDGELPWVPVLQGWTESDYLRHAEQYERTLGFPLDRLPLVGVGSVCRRQGTDEVRRIVGRLVRLFGAKLHLFGVKTIGLRKCARFAESADSLAWSYRGRVAWDREKKRLCGGDHKGGCANCAAWAVMWREKVLPKIPQTLFG